MCVPNFVITADLDAICRFIEITEIVVSDQRRESRSRFKVDIRHATGGVEEAAEETFMSEEKASRVTIPCETYVIALYAALCF